MNKLANTYLDAVDSLLAIHLKYPKPDDWIMVMSNLADAVRAMNQELSPSVVLHNFTPVQLAQQEKAFYEIEKELDSQDSKEISKLSKPLTLDDLKRQVDQAVANSCSFEIPNDSSTDFVLTIGDFEIRRRK